MRHKPKDQHQEIRGSRLQHGLVAFLWCALMAGFLVFIYIRALAQPQSASFFSEDQAESGLVAYSQHCASCHGPDLRGLSAPALVGETFLVRWDGRTVASLYDYTHDQMPPGRGGSLSDETYAATLAYVLQQNGLSSGEEDLQPNTARLQTLVITQPANPEGPESSALMSQPFGRVISQESPDVMLVQADMSTRTASTGEQLYEGRCASCHGSDGGGGIGPALTNNPRLEDAAWTIRRIAIGGLGMPAYAHQLSSAEIAEVTSYIRTNFNNDYGAVAANTVNEVVSDFEPSNVQPVTTNLAAAPLGEQRYTQLCAACHGLQGGGGVGPPLAGNTNLDNTQNVVSTLLYGRGHMPAFSLYPDRDIAEISSYIRNTWGNSYGAVSVDVVQIYRPNTAEVPANPTVGSSSVNQNNLINQDDTNQNNSTNQNGEANQNTPNSSQTSPQNQTEQSQSESENGASQSGNTTQSEQQNQPDHPSGQNETTTEQGGNE